MAAADEKTVRITAEDHTAAALKSAGENFAKLHKEIQALRKQTEEIASGEERVSKRRTKAHNTTFESIVEGAMGAMKANAALGGQAHKTGGILGTVGKIGAGALNGMGVAIPGVVGGLASMAAGALGVGAALEVARRGFMGWAAFDTKLRLLQNGTGLTRAGVEGIAEAMRDLSNVTGDTKEELLSAFNELREAGNFTPAETKKMFPDIALVAKGMGADSALVGRAVGDIMRNFKIMPAEVAKVYEGMAYAQEKFNLDISKVGPQLSMVTEGMSRWGYTGADASNRMLAFLGSIKEATGDAGSAASVLTRIMNNMGNETMAKALGFTDAEAFEKDLLASGDALGRMTYLMTTAKNQYDVMHAVGVRDVALWNKMKGELGTMADKIKGVSQATGALDKGLNITDGPENAVKRLTNALSDLTESLGMFLDAFGATTILKSFADDLATISRGAYRLVSLLKWALPGGEKPTWFKSMGEHSYNLQAPKDKMGKNITPYDEYLAGADPQKEAEAYWAKQEKGKTSARDKNERTEYDEKVDRYNQIRKDKPHLRPVMPDIPESIRRDFPNLRPGQKTPTGTTTTAPSGPAPAGATSQGGTTTIQTGPRAVITMPQGQLGATGPGTGSFGPPTGGFKPISYTPGEAALMQTPQGQRVASSMENATKQLASFASTTPDRGKAAGLRGGLVQLASYNPAVDSGLRSQKTGGGEGTHMQGTGPQQYGGSMDARYLRAAYHPSIGGEGGGSTGGDGRGGGATDYGPSSAPTNAPTGPGVQTYSPDQRVPRSERQSPYQRPPVPGRDPQAPVSPTDVPQQRGGGLAGDRAKFKAELDANPALREKVLRIAANEQGKHGLGTQAVLETMMNRASSRGRTLAQEAKWAGHGPGGEGGYYERGNLGRGALEDPAHKKVLEDSLERTLGGSNITDYATDNASQGLAEKRKRNQEMVFTKDFGGESFFRPGRVSGAGNVRSHSKWMERINAQPGTETAAVPRPDAATPPPGAAPAPGAPTEATGGRRLPNLPQVHGEKYADPRLAKIIEAAAEGLPEGYKVQMTSADRNKGATGFHPKGMATDWQIVGPDGKPVSNRGDDTTGLYTKLAQNAYGYQEKYHPELTGQFNWGGSFGTSSKNPNEPDLMHFDVGGRRGRLTRYSREKIGAVLPPVRGATQNAQRPAPAPEPVAAAPAPAPTPAPTPAPAADQRAERDREMQVNLKVNDTQVQFARTSMRRQADREVREARWNSYSDIGAA